MTFTPASRLLRDGRTIYTKVTQSPWGRDLTWRNACGAIIWLGGRCFYAPVFFWRTPA